ncbi:MAG: hypothetical protein ACREUF_17430, partial [Solimonas sp.]
MSGMKYLQALAACLLLSTVGAHPAAADKLVNLLRLPQAKLETTTLVGDRTALSALTDGKADTTADLQATGSDTIDLVYGFDGETVAPELIVVTVPKQGGAVPPSRIEVLASIVSPQSGFHSLRADPIQPAALTQKFSFLPAGARWIMIRLTVPKTGAPPALAEIELLGHRGPPATNYAFSETPARAIDILARLEAVSAVKLAITADEKAAFDKARTGRLDGASLADVALLASGVLDAAKRRTYLARLDALEARARSAVGTKGNPAERADALLRWLHREALTKGYRATQT